MKIQVWRAGDVMSTALAFYSRHGRDAGLDPGDLLVVAEEAGEWIGIVRLCRERNHYLLRTMQVETRLQGKSIGSQILKQFSKEVTARKIGEVYSIAFDYLERFYGQIGFKKVEMAPEFLMERLTAVAKKSPDKQHILMKWAALSLADQGEQD